MATKSEMAKILAALTALSGRMDKIEGSGKPAVEAKPKGKGKGKNPLAKPSPAKPGKPVKVTGNARKPERVAKTEHNPFEGMVMVECGTDGLSVGALEPVEGDFGGRGWVSFTLPDENKGGRPKLYGMHLDSFLLLKDWVEEMTQTLGYTEEE